MNIELHELASLIRVPNTPATQPVEIGQRIVVLDRGFVHAGRVTEYSDRIVITEAWNIRYWGTTNGLGELANGPTEKTKMDKVGSVEAYRHAVMFMIPCKGF